MNIKNLTSTSADSRNNNSFIEETSFPEDQLKTIITPNKSTKNNTKNDQPKEPLILFE